MKQVGLIDSDEVKQPQPLPPVTKDRRGKGDYVTLRTRLRSLGAIRIRRVIDNIQDAICAAQNVPGAQPPYVESLIGIGQRDGLKNLFRTYFQGQNPSRKTPCPNQRAEKLTGKPLLERGGGDESQNFSLE